MSNGVSKLSQKSDELTVGTREKLIGGSTGSMSMILLLESPIISNSARTKDDNRIDTIIRGIIANFITTNLDKKVYKCFVAYYSMPPEEPSLFEENIGAPFNMAIATLMKIHGVTKGIVVASAFSPESEDDARFLFPGKAQHTKYRLVKQFFVQSVPLLDQKKTTEWQEEMLNRIWEIKPKIGERVSGKKIVGHYPIYDEQIERELDRITIEIEKKLQEEGYFMPPKSDVRYSWRQD